MPTIIWAKSQHKLDSSLKKKAYAFLEKLSDDDTSPGLHIERIAQCADSKVRTGRVDQSFRAVLFRVTSQHEPMYVFYGIWPHDEAIAVAKKATLTVNPVSGISEIGMAEPRTAPDVMHHEPAAAAPSTPALTPEPVTVPLLESFGVDKKALTDLLGIDETLAGRALAAADEEELLVVAGDATAWQGMALLDLGTGISVDEVRKKLDLVPEPAAPVSSESPVSSASPDSLDEEAEDERIVEGMKRPAALMSFAFIYDNAELRRVIEEGDFGAWRVFLHPEQRRYAQRSYNGPFRLSGGAGTGKTVVLLHRARMLAKCDPRPRVVLTTYTKNLADALQADLDRLDPSLLRATSLGAQGVLVSGIDSLAAGVLRRAGTTIADDAATVLGTATTHVTRRTPRSVWNEALDTAGTGLPPDLRSVPFLIAEYGQVVLANQITARADYFKVRRPGRGVVLDRAKRSAVWDVVEEYRAQSRVNGTVDFEEAAAIAAAHLNRTPPGGVRAADHVLVDEGQDLTPAHWRFIRALAAPGKNDLFIAEDSHQRIYGQRIRLSAFGINIVGRSRRLTLNYRTTAQNLAYAVGVLQGGDYVDLDGEAETFTGYRSARRGPVPRFIGCATLSEELQQAASLVKKWADETSAGETIAVLVREQRMRDRVVTALSEDGVPIRAVDREPIKPGRPVAMTMHRAKGTEFSKVLLFGVDASAVPRPMRDEEYADEALADALLRERSLLYVAATRARDELAVSWNGDPSSLLPVIQ